MKYSRSKKAVAALALAGIAAGAGFLLWNKITAPHAAPQKYLSPAPVASSQLFPSHSTYTHFLARKKLDSMTPEEKVYQLFMVRPEDFLGSGTVTQFSPELKEAMAAKPVGGVIFFRDNLSDPDQTRQLLSDFQASASIPLFLGVDEEGGIVQRLGCNPSMGVTDYPPMGRTESDAEAREIGLTLGTQIGALGFNLDFAPVADVNSNPDNPIIGTRAFSSDPQEAAGRVAACVEGFRESGTLSCLKHFPGHGDTAQDSHYGYAESARTMEELENAEFLPFLSGIRAQAPLVMVGHITLPNAAEDGLPASMSGFWMEQVLRQKLGFEGIIVTDALEMGAITDQYPQPGQSALAAFQAGADLLLCPDSLSRGAAAILEAVENGSISQDRLNESVLRILTAKYQYGILPVSQ